MYVNNDFNDELPWEVDLHIEKLVKDHAHLSSGYILHIQLSFFRDILDKAIVNDMSKFYVIHGIGKGRLKVEIHEILVNSKEVKSFNNDYFAKFGFGATEIVLR